MNCDLEKPRRLRRGGCHMYWFLLIVAGLFEAVWAIGLEYSEGFSGLKWSVVTLIALSISMVLLSKALEGLSVGTAYTVWTGIGACLTAIAGVYLLNETGNLSRIFFIGLIITGIIGLQITSG